MLRRIRRVLGRDPELVGGPQRPARVADATRPSITTSAAPSTRTCSACAGSVIRPTAADRQAADLAHLAGERHLVAGADGIFWCATAPPDDTSIRSTPCCRAARRAGPSRRRSSRPRPVGRREAHEQRLVRHTARTASTTRRSSRVRFSNEPPYSSVRWLAAARGTRGAGSRARRGPRRRRSRRSIGRARGGGERLRRPRRSRRSSWRAARHSPRTPAPTGRRSASRPRSVGTVPSPSPNGD